ncbi:MAG: M48 family metalloprotease [Candidatus Latescibacteria bacterium]|nr:M48 family metalloprotease [Candidatus Latescibacterota bacterium]
MKTITRREALSGMGALAGVSILSGCAVNPVTGKPEFMLMSENREIRMGGEAHGQIKAQYGVYSDESIQQWFTDMGTSMAKISHRKGLPWTFTVLDSPVINAFAVPGGYIYVTRGILGYLNNEAQFAGVLGHELGHVNARHTAARYSKAQLATLGIALGSIFSEEFAQFADLASLGTSLLFLKFSRDNERQADSLGVEYSSKSNYDAVEISEFFRTLERLRPKGGSLPTWQSTHPDPGDRIAATKKQALAFQKAHPDMKFRVRREEYLELIDGIIYGDDPRQGYVKDRVFYHPEMKFSFPVPAGWNVMNMPTEVRMSPEKQDSLLIFTVTQGTTPRDAAAAFNQENKVTVTTSKSLSINDRDAYKTMGQIPMNGQAAGISSHFITFGDKVFAFHGLCAPQMLTAMDTVFSTTALGFGGIEDPAFIDVSPKRLTVKTLEKTTTVRAALSSFGVGKDKLDEFAILNGLGIDDQIDAGRKLKVVES